MAPDPASRRGQHLPRPSRVEHPLRACEGRWKPTEGKSPETALGDAPDPSRDEGAERTDRAEHGADEKVGSEPPVLSPFDMVANQIMVAIPATRTTPRAIAKGPQART